MSPECLKTRGDNGAGKGERKDPRLFSGCPPTQAPVGQCGFGPYSKLRIFPSRLLLGRPRWISSRVERGAMARRRRPRVPKPQHGNPMLAPALASVQEVAPRESVRGGDHRKEASPRTSRPAHGLPLPAAPAAPPLRPGRRDAAMAAAAVAPPEVLRECGCKGIRTCLICERQRGGDPPWQHPSQVRGGRGAAAPTTPCFVWGN